MTAITRDGGDHGDSIRAPLTLRAGRRREEGVVFFAYPALIPQRAPRTSGTDWARRAKALSSALRGLVHGEFQSMVANRNLPLACSMRRRKRGPPDAIYLM